jgi:putative membrane protein
LIHAIRSARASCSADHLPSSTATGRTPPETGGDSVVDLLVKVVINAIAVYAAIQLPFTQITFDYGNDWWKLLAVALILAIINTYLKPILKILSFPITLLSLGLFALVLNALLLLLVALISDQLDLGFKIADFPPTFNADAFIGALLGSIVISVVATAIGLVNRGRRLVV